MRSDGSWPLRRADRQALGLRLQLPPRFTRSEPNLGPTGSTPSESFPSYQSEHHSFTLPCISYKPHGFGFFNPTLWAYLSRPALPGLTVSPSYTNPNN